MSDGRGPGGDWLVAFSREGEVVITVDPDSPAGSFHFTPTQARQLGMLLFSKAADAENESLWLRAAKLGATLPDCGHPIDALFLVPPNGSACRLCMETTGQTVNERRHHLWTPAPGGADYHSGQGIGCLRLLCQVRRRRRRNPSGGFHVEEVSADGGATWKVGRAGGGVPMPPCAGDLVPLPEEEGKQ